MKLPLGVTIGLGFAPFAVFLLVARAGSPGVALWAACATAVVIAALNLMARRPPRVLEVGSAVLFAALAGVTALTGWNWTFMTLRLAVDTGLFLIIAGSLVAGRPFTLQYARERVPEAFWHAPLFVSVNNRITAVWAAAFVVLIAAHAATAASLGLSIRGDLIVTWAVLIAAVIFSLRYPAYARKIAATAAGTV